VGGADVIAVITKTTITNIIAVTTTTTIMEVITVTPIAEATLGEDAAAGLGAASRSIC
jgi:hypothetical protein